MIKKKSLIFVLVAILGFPQISLAQTLIKTDTLVNSNDSLEIAEDNLLLTQGRRTKNNRRRRARNTRRQVRGAYKPGRSHQRRRNRRRNFRNRARVGAAATGLIGVGIGAAIADSIREDEAITEAIILDSMDDGDYDAQLYDTDFDYGGYYDDGFDDF